MAANPNGPNSHLEALARFARLRSMGAEYTNPERYEETQQWLANKAWQEKLRADEKTKARRGERVQ